MSTYARLLREASGVTPASPTDLPRGELLRAVARMHAELADMTSEADKQLRLERAKSLEQWARMAGNEQRMLAALEETRGKNRRNAVQFLQADVANIRNNMTALADTTSPALQKSLSAAITAGTGAGRPGTNAANIAAWSALLGDLLNAGEINDANLQLPNLFRQMEMEGFGSIDDLLSLPEVETGSDLAVKAARSKRIAEAALEQKITAQRKMDDDLGALGGIITSLANSDSNANVDGLIQQASGYINTLYGNLNKFEPKPPSDAANDLNVYLAGNDAFQELKKSTADLEARLDSTPGTDKRQQIAAVIGDPNFREWADSNGWKIGTAQYDAASGRWLYAQGKDDARALKTYEWQLKHDPQQLIHDYNTRTWLAVEVKGSGEDVSLQNSRNMALLASAAGADPTAPLFAATTNEAGNPVYLTGEQLDSIISARADALPETFRVFQHKEGRLTSTYLYDPKTATLYEDDGKTGKWVESKKTLAEVGYDANTISTAAPAVVATPDGGYFPVERAELPQYSVRDVVPATTEEFTTLQGQYVQKMLSDSGISITTDPPPTPTYMIYGKEIRQHATDPVGSLRISTADGEQLIEGDRIVNRQVTQRGSTTSLLDARDRARGARNLTQAGTPNPDPGGTFLPRLADKIAAVAEAKTDFPVSGPKVTPAVVSGRERIEDGFGTGTFMDSTPVNDAAVIPTVARAAGMPDPTAMEVAASRQGLSDNGSRTELEEALAVRNQSPIVEPEETTMTAAGGDPLRAVAGPADGGVDSNSVAVATDIGRRIRERLEAKAASPLSTRGPGVASSGDSIKLKLSQAEIDPVPAPPTEAAPSVTPEAAPLTSSTSDDTIDGSPVRIAPSTSTAPSRPWAKERARVEAATKGAATVNDLGEVVSTTSGPLSIDHIYSPSGKTTYDRFLKYYPENATASSTASASPAAAPAAPPTSPRPEAPATSRREIDSARPVIERASQGRSTVDANGVVVPAPASSSDITLRPSKAIIDPAPVPARPVTVSPAVPNWAAQYNERKRQREEATALGKRMAAAATLPSDEAMKKASEAGTQ